MASNPILDPGELKAHLNLLRAFHDLKSQVENGSKLEFDARTLSAEERWKSFVQASVERFYGWISGLRVGGDDMIERMKFPSLDICLVWHAYMLNPSRYTRDIKQLEALKPLGVLKPSLLNLFTSDSLVGENPLSESRTGSPLDAAAPFTTNFVKGESYPFSLDLAAAVLRQTSFTEKMVNLGWTEQGFFNNVDNSDTLERCIARYQG